MFKLAKPRPAWLADYRKRRTARLKYHFPTAYSMLEGAWKSTLPTTGFQLTRIFALSVSLVRENASVSFGCLRIDS